MKGAATAAKRWVRRQRTKVLRPLRGEADLKALELRGLRIGERAHIGSGTFIDPSHAELITIGDDVTLSPRVMLIAHDTASAWDVGTRVGRIDIEDEVYIGACAIVLPGVRIGRGSRVGAGSVVTRSVPPMSVVAGSPARVIMSVDEFLDRHRARMHAHPERVWAGPARTAAAREEMRDRLEAGDGYLSEGFFTGRFGRPR